MKLKNKIIAMLGLSLLLSLMSSGATAQPQPRFLADTGIISGGPNQIIRLTVSAAGNDTITVRFMETDYVKGPCSPDGTCKYTVKSEKTTAPLMLAPGEGASFDLSSTEDSHPYPNALFARGVVLSNSRNVQVTVQIIDTATGNVVVAFKPGADVSTVGQ